MVPVEVETTDIGAVWACGWPSPISDMAPAMVTVWALVRERRRVSVVRVIVDRILVVCLKSVCTVIVRVVLVYLTAAVVDDRELRLLYKE